MSSYKQTRSFEERNEMSKRMMQKYPDRIPVIIEKAKDGDTENLPKIKYLIPRDFTIAQFMTVLRKKIELSEKKSIFLYTDNGIPPSSESISQLYNDQVDGDGFLYMKYATENTFG